MKYLLVDGSGFFWRVFSACPPRLHEGRPVAAIEGFIKTLLRPLVERSKEERVCVIFDVSGPTFRNEIYPAYKANRNAPPEGLLAQAPYVREAVRAYGFSMIEKECFEADDIIATLARQASFAGDNVIVATGDKDMMQLVSDRVSLFDQKKKIMVREKDVIEKFSITPLQFIDMQALMGDIADNVPGAPGIGKVTAANLLIQFGSIEGIYENIELVKSERIRNILKENRKPVFISRSLVRLADNVPLEVKLEDLHVARPVCPGEFLSQHGLSASLAPRFSRRFPDWQPEPGFGTFVKNKS